MNISWKCFRDTSLSTLAEVPSRYHFAAHMGQLISGLEGQGCHNFFPSCPLPSTSVLNMMKKIRLRWTDARSRSLTLQNHENDNEACDIADYNISSNLEVSSSAQLLFEIVGSSMFRWKIRSSWSSSRCNTIFKFQRKHGSSRSRNLERNHDNIRETSVRVRVNRLADLCSLRLRSLQERRLFENVDVVFSIVLLMKRETTFDGREKDRWCSVPTNTIFFVTIVRRNC